VRQDEAAAPRATVPATRLFVDRTATPLGELTIVADADDCLRLVGWDDREASLRDSLRLQFGVSGFALEPKENPGGLTAALRAYFAGQLSAIDALPAVMGGTPFQRLVWAALREIPCGATWSYAQLAQRIGRPSAVRAVGLANGANPVAVVVPCHRVIGADGSLTGYGGGLERKRWLLAHEGQRLTLPFGA
jgi:methylated-DNA-[protein]-cysteine S-methyltransferase